MGSRRRASQKRGQISLFMIIAAVLVVAGGVTIFLFNSGSEDTEIEEDVPFEPQSINRYLESCLYQESVPRIYELARKGGIINTTGHDSVMYYNKTFYYHCLYEGGSGCVNELITRRTMESELNTYIEQDIRQCINLTPFEKDKGYDVSAQEPVVSTQIGVRDVYVTLHYPIVMERDDFSIRSDDVSVSIKSDLGYLYDLAVQIRNNEITDHFFDIDSWMRYNGDTRVYRNRPYPDVTYEISRYNHRVKNELSFLFAIDGLDTVEYIGIPEELPEENLHGYCMTPDENCHANVRASDCHEILGGSPIGTYNNTPGTCTGLSDIMGRAGKETPKAARFETDCDPSGSCDDCSNGMVHGESRCLFDGPAGEGWDYVGSRHYVIKCFDGEVIIEGCRDYREELCAENPSEGEAICRINRWHDCSDQETREDCLNQSLRDCDWNPDLFDSSVPTRGIKSDKTPCHPEVPPGFKHWKLPYNKVCQVANEHRECDGFQCPTTMNERQNLNCVYQGDCGMWRNIVDTKTSEGFHSLNPNNITRVGKAYPPTGLLDMQQGPLNVSFKNMSQPYLSNNIYWNSQGTLEKILQQLNAFIQEASGWDLCTFCDHGWYCGPPCTYDVNTQFATVCSSWQPPDGGSSCDECDNDWRKPCTKYRCRSLGKTCEFTRVNGVGHCEDAAPGDTTGPLISLENVTYEGNYTVKKMNPFWGFIFNIDSYYICHGTGSGACTDDVGGSDGLEPYAPLSIRLNLSEEARCKTFPVDFFEFDDIPEIIPTKESYVFNDTFTIQTKVSSVESVYEQLRMITGYSSIFQVVQVDEVDELVNDTYSNLVSLMSSWGADTSDVDSFYTYYMANISTPLRNYISSYQNSIDQLALTMDARVINTFVKCVDRSGNNQEKEFLVQYTIGPDTKPPELERVSPPNTSAVTSPFKISLWYNEPAVCKYDYADKPYASMEHKLDCPTGTLSLQQRGYRCTGLINTTTFPIDLYVRCLDQPKIQDIHYITLVNASSTNPIYGSPTPTPVESAMLNKIKVNTTYDPDRIHVTDPSALKSNVTAIYNINETAELRIDFDSKQWCRFSVNDYAVNFSEMPYSLTCIGNNCTYKFDPLPADFAQIKISCVLPYSNPRNEGSYYIRYALY